MVAGVTTITASTTGIATAAGRISRFIPKNPATKLSGRKIVAASVRRAVTWVSRLFAFERWTSMAEARSSRPVSISSVSRTA